MTRPQIPSPQDGTTRNGPFAAGPDAEPAAIVAADDRIRAVLFDRNLNGHPLTLEQIEALDSLSDDQLLWIDVQGDPADLPEAVLRHGIDARYMQPGDGGLVSNGGQWRYYLRARARGAGGRDRRQCGRHRTP